MLGAVPLPDVDAVRVLVLFKEHLLLGQGVFSEQPGDALQFPSLGRRRLLYGKLLFVLRILI